MVIFFFMARSRKSLSDWFDSARPETIIKHMSSTKPEAFTGLSNHTQQVHDCASASTIQICEILVSVPVANLAGNLPTK